MEKIRKVAKVAVLQGNFLSMDFEGNMRILQEGIAAAVKEKATLLVCPELCITGTQAEDHFFERDTHTHSWEVLARLLKSNVMEDILCGFGMPVVYNNALYNCIVYCKGKEVVLIRPKSLLHDSGNVRQSRWFTPWTDIATVCDYELPGCVREIEEQETCRFGGAIIYTNDGISIYPLHDNELENGGGQQECCAGVDILAVSAASHHEIGRYDKLLTHLSVFSRQNKCVLLYANPLGCDGSRLYYEGGSTIWTVGGLLVQAPRFALDSFNIAVATVDLQSVRAQRLGDKGWGTQTVIAAETHEFVNANLDLATHPIVLVKPSIPLSEPMKLPLHEELALSAGNWLWDYMRRCKAIGFFIALSGGADSSACVTIVALLAERLLAEYQKKNPLVVQELQRIGGGSSFDPKSARDILRQLLVTSYLGTENSSKETRGRALKLSEQTGHQHFDGSINEALAGLNKTLESITKFVPKFEKMGGTKAEDLALQNLQARSRLILSYYIAQVLPMLTHRAGFFLAVATGNGDECIRGYFTKYDNSSGDLDPIGSWSKGMVNALLDGNLSKFPVLQEVRKAIPTAELKPLEGDKQLQTDEGDMGFTYAELAVLARLREEGRCGPVSMFEQLMNIWSHLGPEAVGDKVKRFFRYYAINRHKMTTLPPGLHSSASNCDDNRYDQRPILYNTDWTFQFHALDELIAAYKQK